MFTPAGGLMVYAPPPNPKGPVCMRMLRCTIAELPLSNVLSVRFPHKYVSGGLCRLTEVGLS